MLGGRGREAEAIGERNAGWSGEKGDQREVMYGVGDGVGQFAPQRGGQECLVSDVVAHRTPDGNRRRQVIAVQALQSSPEIAGDLRSMDGISFDAWISFPSIVVDATDVSGIHQAEEVVEAMTVVTTDRGVEGVGMASKEVIDRKQAQQGLTLVEDGVSGANHRGDIDVFSGQPVANEG